MVPTEDLADVMKGAFASFLADVHTALPGTILTYVPATKTATVLPSIKMKFADELVSRPMPIITDVQVIFPGSKTAGITFPLLPGDGCLLLFSEASLERWIASTGAAVEPGDPRRFALTDGFCIPGLFPPASPGKIGTGTGMEIMYMGNTIHLTDAGIVTINGQTKPFVTWAELNAALQALIGLLMAHVHTCAAPGAPSSVPTSPIIIDISAAMSAKVMTG